MIFYKFRHNFADGPGNWEYSFLSPNLYQGIDDVSLRDWIAEEIGGEFEWSEHYRGFEWERVGLPPADVLELMISESDAKARYYSQLTKALKDVENESSSV